MPENIPIGATVATVTASDPDEAGNSRLVYSIMTPSQRPFSSVTSSLSSTAISGPFAINKDTGHVTVVTSLDRETCPEHVINILARDSPLSGPALSAYARLVVTVTDINDNAPTLRVHSMVMMTSSQNGDGNWAEVNENAPVGSFVAHLSVSDYDVGPNGQVRCRLVSGEAEFQLISIGSAEYKMVAGRQLDRETRDLYRPEVTCTVTMIMILFSVKLFLTVNKY